jgi:hypothetical protein
MKFLQVFAEYLKWHYSKAVISAFYLWKNLTVFFFNYFSIKILFINFFSPWRRMSEYYPKWYQFKEFFSAILLNTLMRIVGVIIRIPVIIFGSVFVFLFAVSFPIFLLLWLVLPLLIVGLMIIGVIWIIFG